MLLRITPGVPVFIGNYLLPLGGVGLKEYLLISFPIQFGFAIGFIIFGDSIMAGNIRWGLLAVALIIALKLVLRTKPGDLVVHPLLQ